MKYTRITSAKQELARLVVVSLENYTTLTSGILTSVSFTSSTLISGGLMTDNYVAC